jgi:hypothetical protein
VRTVPALLLVLLALLVGGCGSSDAGPATTAAVPSGPKIPAEPEAGKVLEEFVRAAGRHDAQAMWKLLSPASQAQFGPTDGQFVVGAGKEFGATMGEFERSGEWKLVVAARPSAEWAVAAISGYIVTKGKKSYGAYASPLRQIGGKWYLEPTGSVKFTPATPDPDLLSKDSTPSIGSELAASEPILDAVIWVDELTLTPTLSADELFISGDVLAPIEKGWHTVVTFADTQSTAGANAFTFQTG